MLLETKEQAVDLDANEVIRVLRTQLADVHWQLTLMTVRAEQAEAALKASQQDGA